MRPGITIQHAALPDRPPGIVRGDIAAMLCFVPRARWPDEASSGDYTEVQLRRAVEVREHPHRDLIDEVTTRAAVAFFENGGDTLHLFAVCVEDITELQSRDEEHGPLAPLLRRLRSDDDLGLIAVPSAATWRCEVRRDGTVRSVADALWDDLLLLCRQVNHRFLVIDAPRDLHGETLVRWVEALRARDVENRAFGAVYYPWLRRGDTLVAPSGAIMGLMARLELERAPFGISEPPANAPLRGVTHPEVDLDWGEVSQLNEAHVNAMISQPGRGVVAWGARTLSRDPAWLHVNSRRVVGLIAEQLRRDNEWAVFETNAPELWKVLERDVSVRLREFWEAGLIAGTRARPEFAVRCDSETNPTEMRETGGLNVAVALTPIGTTESILVDLRIGG
jgi:hypothetical protein